MVMTIMMMRNGWTSVSDQGSSWRVMTRRLTHSLGLPQLYPTNPSLSLQLITNVPPKTDHQLTIILRAFITPTLIEGMTSIVCTVFAIWYLLPWCLVPWVIIAMITIVMIVIAMISIAMIFPWYLLPTVWRFASPFLIISRHQPHCTSSSSTSHDKQTQNHKIINTQKHKYILDIYAFAKLHINHISLSSPTVTWIHSANPLCERTSNFFLNE